MRLEVASKIDQGKAVPLFFDMGMGARRQAKKKDFIFDLLTLLLYFAASHTLEFNKKGFALWAGDAGPHMPSPASPPHR